MGTWTWGGSLPARRREAPGLRGRQLTESSVYNLVSLNWNNLYSEAFEMSRDLGTFPFLGAFAPCSDKQLKKTKTSNTQMGRGSASVQGSADRSEVETLTQFCRERGAGMKVGPRAEQDRSGCKPHLSALDGVFWPETPQGIPKALKRFPRPFYPGSQPPARAAGLGEGTLTQYPGPSALLY